MIGFQGRAAGRLATETRETHGEFIGCHMYCIIILEFVPILLPVAPQGNPYYCTSYIHTLRTTWQLMDGCVRCLACWFAPWWLSWKDALNLNPIYIHATNRTYVSVLLYCCRMFPFLFAGKKNMSPMSPGHFRQDRIPSHGRSFGRRVSR